MMVGHRLLQMFIVSNSACALQALTGIYIYHLNRIISGYLGSIDDDFFEVLTP